MPLAGRERARIAGEPVSYFRSTDDERRMRDLAWGVVMPPLEEQRLERTLVELRRTRILPADRVAIHKASYVAALLDIDFRSSTGRYARLQTDVEADIARIEPFFQAAARVSDGDRVRAKALARLPELRADEHANAVGRIEENGLLIAWVRRSFDERLVAYRYALDRLVLETPDRSAIAVEGSLTAFAQVLESLRPLGRPEGVFKG